MTPPEYGVERHPKYTMRRLLGEVFKGWIEGIRNSRMRLRYPLGELSFI